MFSNIFDINKISSFLVFLTFSLALILPNGYMYGAIPLVIAGFYLLFKPSSYPIKLNRDEKLLILIFFLYGFFCILENYLYSQALRDYDKPSRFILAIAAFIFLIKSRVKPIYFWLAIAVGSIASGILSIYQVYFLDYARASGFTNAIQYGNLSMLFGVLSLVYAVHAKNIYSQARILFFIAFFFGLVASLLSGSRGGWIGLPLILLYIFSKSEILSHRSLLNDRSRVLRFLSGFVVLITLVFFIAGNSIYTRFSEALNDIYKYQEGDSSGSLGTRLELWKAAVLIIEKSPIVGHGEKGYVNELITLVDNNTVSPAIISHPHNEILDVGVRRGLVGVLLLGMLYTIPLIIFFRHSKAGSAIAVGGSVVVFCYIDFGLTQTFFSHDNGVMMYLYLIMFLTSAKFSSD